MRAGIFLTGLAGLGLMLPAMPCEASHFVALSAHHGFTVLRPGHRAGFARPGRGRYFSGTGWVETLQSGSFTNATPDMPEEAPQGLLPYPPPNFYPIYYRPPRPCVRPLIIYIGPEPRAAKNLPKVVYGSGAPSCN